MPENEDKISEEIKEIVSSLNRAINAAAEKGIQVELQGMDATKMESPVRVEIYNVKVFKAL